MSQLVAASSQRSGICFILRLLPPTNKSWETYRLWAQSMLWKYDHVQNEKELRNVLDLRDLDEYFHVIRGTSKRWSTSDKTSGIMAIGCVGSGILGFLHATVAKAISFVALIGGIGFCAEWAIDRFADRLRANKPNGIAYYLESRKMWARVTCIALIAIFAVSCFMLFPLNPCLAVGIFVAATARSIFQFTRFYRGEKEFLLRQFATV